MKDKVGISLTLCLCMSLSAALGHMTAARH